MSGAAASERDRAHVLLLEAFRQHGDDLTFRPLYSAVTPAAYGFALRLAAGDRTLADDLVQEAWARVLERLGRFDGTSVTRWLNGVVVNCWRERRRAERLETSATDEELEAAQSPEGPAVDGWTERPVLERLIADLPNGYRAVLLLHDVEGYTHHEIASLLGVDVGTSKSQLSRARHHLRRRLGHPGPSSGAVRPGGAT